MSFAALLPYALGAIGAVQGFRSARDSGSSGIGSLISAGLGGFGGYSLGGSLAGLLPGATQATLGQQIAKQGSSLVYSRGTNPKAFDMRGKMGSQIINLGQGRDEVSGGGGLSNILDFFKKADGEGYDPLKVSLAAGAVPFLAGAFDQAPVDIYQPGYNVGYLDMRDKRPGFKYIDPETGQEKEYERVYAPEEQARDARRLGNLSLNVTRLNTGGIAQIKKFNEGGVNYLPSKVSHDENDSNNYVRASGYVEDGSGAGDKDEDTMLAQLADGEFVTRADGVLGAGIIAGGNPNSMKDMREKGAQYFYEQQKRYKRVFDLLKEKNGDSQQKIN
jgi:hypothetical protein